MTLPDERYRALAFTEKFLIELIRTPRVPKEVKEKARGCLRHYPSTYDLDRLAKNSPDILDKEPYNGKLRSPQTDNL